MAAQIADQVIDFYSGLFESLFSEPFRLLLPDRLKRKAVERQIEESSDAASQSLTRFFLNQQVTETETATILAGCAALCEALDLERISNPNVTPEGLAEELLERVPVPGGVQESGHEPVYRVALHSILQVLLLVGPVMAEWRKLAFASTFELPRRVVNRLNEISLQLDTLGQAGESAAAERYDLNYRDYLLQRFHRVEAGTVRMTTSLNVDLRELFVMPRLKERQIPAGKEEDPETAKGGFMALAEARRIFTRSTRVEGQEVPSALEQVKRCARLVVVGTPGSGKSTFLEWLQLKVASAEEALVLADQQAIPLLLRMRQLDPRNLPRGAGLIERATASRDRASLMPAGWIDRQMKKGRVLLMLDGLDETEPELRDRYVLPWLEELCGQYPDCRYLVSSRPVGYPPGSLRKLGFVEADLMDFGEPEIADYTRHWCTAIRLARNELEGEARREGIAEGERIVASFQSHPYISNLARNPLMLSAICLVNYFERGKLPEERAVLYRLCVEGLLHHWDQRRGIQSEFTLAEKLRACREVALSMQAEDCAEFSAESVRDLFGKALGDPGRAEVLLEHVRYRTGLLLERRAGIFAFAHLTFQEYLAACAIHEGSHVGIGVERLIREYGDARWREVLALYCGLVPVPAARKLLGDLVAQEDSDELAEVLADAYLSGGPELAKDEAFRTKVLRRIAVLPGFPPGIMGRFPEKEVAPIANLLVGQGKIGISQAFRWLQSHPRQIDWEALKRHLAGWRERSPVQLGDLIYLAHAVPGHTGVFSHLMEQSDVYSTVGPTHGNAHYPSQAEVALLALMGRKGFPSRDPGFDAAFLHVLRLVCKIGLGTSHWYSIYDGPFKAQGDRLYLPLDHRAWKEYATLARRVAELSNSKGSQVGEIGRERSASRRLLAWADALDKQDLVQTPKKRRTSTRKR